MICFEMFLSIVEVGISEGQGTWAQRGMGKYLWGVESIIAKQANVL
jgi:hypothetical protein